MSTIVTDWKTSDVRFKGIYIGQKKHRKTVDKDFRMFYAEIIENDKNGSCSMMIKEFNTQGVKALGGKHCLTKSLKEAKDKFEEYLNKRLGDENGR